MGRVAETSIEAMKSVAEYMPSIRERIYRAIEWRGEFGATIDELASATDTLTQTVCPSVNSLMKEGRIVRNGQKRLTRSGRNAFVMVISRLAPPDRS